MNRTSLSIAAGAALAVAGLILSASRTASAQIIIGPPAVFVATSEPVYYEGHSAYWYHDRWYWRGPHGWSAYDHEPAYLHDRRVREPPRRWHYEHRR